MIQEKKFDFYREANDLFELYSDKKNIRNLHCNKKELREDEKINFYKNKITKEKKKEENIIRLLYRIYLFPFWLTTYIFIKISNIQNKDKKEKSNIIMYSKKLLFDSIDIIYNFFKLVLIFYCFVRNYKFNGRLKIFTFNSNDKNMKNKIENNNHIFNKKNKNIKKRKLFYIIIIFFVFIFKSNCQDINLSSINYSYITMKINKGNNLVFSSHQNISWWSNIDSFYNNFTEPDEIYINGIIQTEIKNKYYFSETTNTVILIYKHPITDCAAMFWTCNEIV